MCYRVRPASTYTLDKMHFVLTQIHKIKCISFWHRYGRKSKNPKQSNSNEQHDDFILAEKKLSPVNTVQQTGILVDINRICYCFISLEEQQYAISSMANNSSLSPPSNMPCNK